MTTADRDVTSVPVPWYWIVCLTIAGLSVICGIITCICIDRHMKKKLLAYLNEHEELQSVVSEDEIKARSSSDTKKTRESTAGTSKNGAVGSKESKPVEKIPHYDDKTLEEINSKRAAKKLSKQDDTKPSASKHPKEDTNIELSATSVVASGNYFEEDKDVEADMLAMYGEPKPKLPAKLEPLEHRPVPNVDSNKPVKNLKKRGTGIMSSSVNPIVVAAIATTAFTKSKKDSEGISDHRSDDVSRRSSGDSDNIKRSMTSLHDNDQESSLTEVSTEPRTCPAQNAETKHEETVPKEQSDVTIRNDDSPVNDQVSKHGDNKTVSSDTDDVPSGSEAKAGQDDDYTDFTDSDADDAEHDGDRQNDEPITHSGKILRHSGLI